MVACHKITQKVQKNYLGNTIKIFFETITSGIKRKKRVISIFRMSQISF